MVYKGHGLLMEENRISYDWVYTIDRAVAMSVHLNGTSVRILAAAAAINLSLTLTKYAHCLKCNECLIV